MSIFIVNICFGDGKFMHLAEILEKKNGYTYLPSINWANFSRNTKLSQAH